MTGLLAVAGMRVDEQRVGQSLRTVASQQQPLRAHMAYSWTETKTGLPQSYKQSKGHRMLIAL